MRIKLDENLSKFLADDLRLLGHDADTAADENLLGLPDTKVWDVARSDNRTLFTLDLDFADNRQFPPGDHPGIVVFRPRLFGESHLRSQVLAFVLSDESRYIHGAIVIVEPTRVRIRRADPQ